MAKEVKSDANSPEEKFVQALLKSTGVNISDDSLSGALRGATITNVSEKELEKMSIGISSSLLGVGEFFKIVGLRKASNKIQGRDNTSLIAIIETPNGEQRPIYVSSLFRTPPLRNNELNEYTDEEINFNVGILQGSAGLSVPKRLERIGMGWIKVGGDMTFNTKAIRQQAGGLPGQEIGTSVEFQSRVFNLVKADDAEVEAARTAA